MSATGRQTPKRAAGSNWPVTAQEPQSEAGRIAELLADFLPLPVVPVRPAPDPTPSEGPDPYGNPDPEWLRIDWREHLRRIELDSAHVNYAEVGGGPGMPVVFVHGLSGSWQNWLENIAHFADNHRVLALDLPGFGASPIPDWEISIESYGRLLHDFCEALGVRDCAVVGNSMGGFVCAEAAIASPGRFRKLALVSAAGISHAHMRRRPAEMAGRFAVASSPLTLRFEGRGIMRPKLRYWVFRMLVEGPHELRPELLWELFHNGAGKPGFLPAIQGLIGYDILDRLEEVEIPTLIVWGRNDRIVPAADALGYGQRLRNSRTVILDRTGHLPMAERPMRFNRLLEAFLAEEAA
jgi:pimeloyl-ACP methyl ester carboxylesterase